MTDFNSQFKTLNEKTSTRLELTTGIGLVTMTASVVGICLIANMGRAEPHEIHITKQQAEYIEQASAQKEKPANIQKHENNPNDTEYSLLNTETENAISEIIVSGSDAATMRFLYEIRELSFREIPELNKALFDQAFDMAAEKMYSLNKNRNMTATSADSLIQTILKETRTALVDSLKQTHDSENIVATIEENSTMLVKDMQKEIHDENTVMDFIEEMHDRLPKTNNTLMGNLAYITLDQIKPLNDDSRMLGYQSDKEILQNTRNIFITLIRKNFLDSNISNTVETIADDIVSELLSNENPSEKRANAVLDNSYTTFPVRQIEGQLYQIENYIRFKNNREINNRPRQNDI